METDLDQQQGRVRPVSVVARNFSEDLDTLFGLHSGTTIGNLNETVQKKKRIVSTQEQELAAIEARLREAEDRLAQASGTSPPSQKTRPTTSDTSDEDFSEDLSEHQASAGAERSAAKRAVSNHASDGKRPSNPRADSSFHPNMPGAMPRTPTPRFEASEYVTVDRSR